MNKNRAIKLLFAFILLVFLSGCTGSVCENPVSAGKPTFESLWQSWQGVIVTGVTLIFIVSGLVYMLAGVASHKGLQVWAKNQISEAIITLLMAVFLIGFVSFICNLNAKTVGAECIQSDTLWCETIGGATSLGEWTGSRCGGPDKAECKLRNVAEWYLSRFQTTLRDAYLTLAVLNWIPATLAGYTWCNNPGGVGLMINLGSGFGHLSSSMSYTLIAIVTALIITFTQIWILKISEQLFIFLVPAGIVLRSFGATRGLGGALIAIGIGFFLVYPLMTVVTYGFLLEDMESINEQMYNAYTGNAPPAQQSMLDPLFNIPLLGTALTFIGTTISASLHLAVHPASLASTLVGLFMAPSVCAQVCVGAAIIPMLIYAILIAFVKNFSSALGQEVDVTLLTRLI